MATADDLRTQVLSLPASDRASLARELLLSLEESDFETDVERAWTEEVERRSEAFSNSETTASNWRESVKRIQESLRRRRNE